MKRKFLFIINPITGKYKVDRLRHACVLNLDKQHFDCTIVQTTGAGHAYELSKTNASSYDAIIAVGGDGTVNEVAKGLIGARTPIGIVPNGSGNGLARHLNYALNIDKALQQLVNARPIDIDILMVNGKPCFNIAGIGFDAHVAQLFQSSKGRGLLNYMLISAKEFLRYDYPSLKITTDQEAFTSSRVFSITLANASQLGNNAVVAKDADLTDGLMDICLIDKYPAWYLPVATTRLFSKSLHRSRYFTGGQSQKVIVDVEGQEQTAIQLDGEPSMTSNPVTFEVQPLALKVLMPQ